jgi:DNA-binding NarL/FixJ family response regulator
VAEDRALVRDAVGGALAQVAADMDIVPIEEAGSVPPDLVLICALSGRRATAAIKALAPRDPADTPIVIVSDIEEPAEILGAFALGAKGYVPTSVDLRIAAQALRIVGAGGSYMPMVRLEPAAAEAAGPHDPATASLPSFSAQQLAVIEALRKGLSNRAIALGLGMTESTVKMHLRQIMRRLDARNRTEVVFLTRRLFPANLVVSPVS